MAKLTFVFLGALIFILVIAFTIFILVVAFRGKSDPTTATTSYITDSTAYTTSRINWTENTRGFPSEGVFPPGYGNSAEAKKIYTILRSYNLEKKYMIFLDVYSILLCQEMQIKSRSCPDTFINDRLSDLNTYGGDPNDQTAIQIVKANTNLLNTKMGKLLVMSCNILENYLKQIREDKAISKQDLEAISGFNSQFYRNKFDFLNKRCP